MNDKIRSITKYLSQLRLYPSLLIVSLYLLRIITGVIWYKLAKLVFSTSQIKLGVTSNNKFLWVSEIQFMRSLQKNLVDSIINIFTIRSSEQNTRIRKGWVCTRSLRWTGMIKCARLILLDWYWFRQLFDRDACEQNLKLYVDIVKLGLQYWMTFWMRRNIGWVQVNKHFKKSAFLPTNRWGWTVLFTSIGYLVRVVGNP